jgi:hypothetical protein
MLKILKNKNVKNILSAVAVTIFGFILLNLTFIFDAFYQGIIRRIVGFFIALGPETNLYWFPPLMHGSFVVIIGLISWVIFRTKWRVLFKAIFMVVPVAVVLVTFGIFLYRWPFILYTISGLFSCGILYYLYKTKLPWLYYYSVILISLILLIMSIMGVDI